MEKTKRPTTESVVSYAILEDLPNEFVADDLGWGTEDQVIRPDPGLSDVKIVQETTTTTTP